MTSRLNRIQKIIELAELELEQASKTFVYMQNKLAEDQGQFASLKEYQREYAQKPSQAGTINPIQLQTHNAFSDKLSQAIVAQGNQVEESEKMLDLAQKNWNEKRIKVKALQALHTRIKNNHQAKLNKQEQQLLDELSSQKYATKTQA